MVQITTKAHNIKNHALILPIFGPNCNLFSFSKGKTTEANLQFIFQVRLLKCKHSSILREWQINLKAFAVTKKTYLGHLQ